MRKDTETHNQPLAHKFINCTFGQTTDFRTENSILKTPYPPEILFLGTFNPDTDSKSNSADFYYGRNWLWPALFNIFEFKRVDFIKQRRFQDNKPDLELILKFCIKHRISFADLIDKVLHKHGTTYTIYKNHVFLNLEKYNLIKDNDLAELNKLDQVSWTTKSIVEYISQNKSIRTIYFTRQPTRPFAEPWKIISQTKYDRDIAFKIIHTPSGQKLSGRPRMKILIQTWLDSGSFHNEWLEKNNIDAKSYI